MSKTYKITGNDVLRLAQRENLTIHCHANPIDDGGIVTLGVAQQIAKDDPSLIYAWVTPTGWRNSQGNHCDSEGRTVEAYFNTYTGEYLGPDDDGVEPCWNDAGTGSKTYRCTDGHVTKEIEAASAKDAAEAYALVTCDVSVVEIDADGNPVSGVEMVKVLIS
jgi:hypothetical protein